MTRLPLSARRRIAAAALIGTMVAPVFVGELGARVFAPFFLFDGEMVFEVRPYRGHEGVPMRSEDGIVLWHFPRDDRPPIRPVKDRIRIVVLGDSVLFPARVADADGAVRKLEEMLNDHLDGGPYEVIDLAEPGFNTLQEERTLFTQGLALQPDLVLVGVTPNDGQEFAIRHGQLMEVHFLRNMLQRTDIVGPLGLLARHSYLYNWLWLAWQKLAHPDALSLSSLVVGKALQRMAVLLHDRGVGFGVLCFPAYDGPAAERLDPERNRCSFRDVPSWAARTGVPFLDLLQAELPYPSPLLRVDNIHRSPFGHDVDAVAIFNWMVDNRLVPYSAVRARPSLPTLPRQ